MQRKFLLIPLCLGIVWSPCLQAEASPISSTFNFIPNPLLAASNADAAKYSLKPVSFKGSVPSDMNLNVSKEDKEKLKKRYYYYKDYDFDYEKQLNKFESPLETHYTAYSRFSFHEQILSEHIKKKTVKRYLADRLYRQLRFKETAGILTASEKSKLDTLAPYFTTEDDLKIKLNMYGEGETNNYGFIDVAVDPAYAIEWYRGWAYGIGFEEDDKNYDNENYVRPATAQEIEKSYKPIRRDILPFTFEDTRRPLSSLLPNRSVDEFFIRRMATDSKNSQEITESEERMLLEIRRLAKPGAKIIWVESPEHRFFEDKISDIESLTGAKYLGKSKFKAKIPGWKKPQHDQYVFQFM